jgi:hypothetical protein
VDVAIAVVSEMEPLCARKFIFRQETEEEVRCAKFQRLFDAPDMNFIAMET